MRASDGEARHLGCAYANAGMTVLAFAIPGLTQSNLPQLRFRSRQRCPSRTPRMATAVANSARTALITGASSGIGVETAQRLPDVLPEISQVILAVRPESMTAAEPVAENVRARGVDVAVVPVELGNIASTRECATEAKKILDGRPLDLLVQNAGVMAPPLKWTDDGIELQYGVNTIAPISLTSELLPDVRKSEEGRIIFVSSLAASLVSGLKQPPLVSSKLRGTLVEDSYTKWDSYAASKLAICMYANALAKKEPSITVASLHPGVVQTNLGRYILPSWMAKSDLARKLTKNVTSLFGLLTPEEGARMSLELASVTKYSIESGAFYVGMGMRQAPKSVAPLLTDAALCEKVLDSSMSFLASFPR